MRDYNHRYAGKDWTTDVLSFPAGEPNFEEEGERHYLGDILISVEKADRQKSGSLEEELKILILHGLLHLLGYDHETDQGEMRSLEIKLRGELKLKSI